MPSVAARSAGPSAWCSRTATARRWSFARAAGIDTLVVEPGELRVARRLGRARSATRSCGAASELVVLAGFMRVLGAPVLEHRVRRPDPQRPSVAAAGIPGHGRDRRRAAAGVARHRRHGPLRRRDAGRRPDRGAGGGDDPARTDDHDRARARASTPWSTGCCRGGRAGRWPAPSRSWTAAWSPTRAVARGAAAPAPRAAVRVGQERAGGARPRPGRARLRAGLDRRHGAGAARGAGLDVTDVAAVTGFPEMLDGRVKTLHPRIAAGVLADWRSEEHRAQLAQAAIDPFELIVVNLYRFAEAAAKPDIAIDELIEEIDIGGPTLVARRGQEPRQRGDRHRPGRLRRRAGRAARARLARPRTAPRLAVRAFALTAGYDTAIAAELRTRLGAGSHGAGRRRRPRGGPSACPRRWTCAWSASIDAALRREPAPGGRALPATRRRIRRTGRSRAARRRCRARS